MKFKIKIMALLGFTTRNKFDHDKSETNNNTNLFRIFKQSNIFEVYLIQFKNKRYNFGQN